MKYLFIILTLLVSCCAEDNSEEINKLQAKLEELDSDLQEQLYIVSEKDQEVSNWRRRQIDVSNWRDVWADYEAAQNKLDALEREFDETVAEIERLRE